MGFDHVGLANTDRYWLDIHEKYRTPQIFNWSFMSRQIDTVVACNIHDQLLVSFQYWGTASISMVKLTGRKIKAGKYLSGLGRWTWARFRGQADAALIIWTFYRPLPPAQRGGTGSIYAQKLTYFNS